MKLGDYIEKNAINKSKFAKKCGLNYYQIYHILNGRIPLLPIALKIEKGTDGFVTPKDLVTEEMYQEIYGEDYPHN